MLAMCGLLFSPSCNRGDQTQEEPIKVVIVPSAPLPEPEPPKESIFDKVKKETTLEGALILSKPLMTDTHNEHSPGETVLTVWALQHMKWADVGVVKDETTFKLVKKDSDEEKGKRLCATGRLIQISVEKTNLGKVYSGLLITNSRDIYSFSNVGSSGSLVEEDRVRTCGIVIGNYSYSNSGGGTGHTVQLVGMFDLPENKT